MDFSWAMFVSFREGISDPEIQELFQGLLCFPLLEVLNMTFLAAKNDDSNDFNDFTHLFLLLFKGKSRRNFTANSCTFAGFFIHLGKLL